MTQKPYYETMYILRPDIPEEEVDSHLTKYSELVTGAGAEVLDSQMRGKRRLAYPIAKHKEGIYVQLSHNGDGQQVAVLEKAMRLSEDVIRYLTIKQEGPLPTPRVATSNENNSEKATSQDKDKVDSQDKDKTTSQEKEKESSKSKDETEIKEESKK